MSTEREFAELVIGILQPEPMRVKLMFGEYCLYHNDKVVAFICDNRVLLKPTTEPLDLVHGLDQAEAYPGSKLYHVVPDDRLNTTWFRETVKALADALPASRPKKKEQPT